MLKLSPFIFKTSTKLFITEFSTQVENKLRWDLASAICLERLPIVTRELGPLENKFQEYLSTVEFENSLKSDFEIRRENDKKQAELLKKGDTSDIDLDAVSSQTAQDFKDACVEELSKFKLAPRVSEADKKNDLTSTDRKLASSLVLLVKQKLGAKDYFLMPQGIRTEGETMKQTAERVLKEACGSNIKYRILGNAPCGFYKYKYPQDAQKDAIGVKVFFFNAIYLKGSLADDKVKSSKWLDRTELYKELPEKYCRSVKQFLIDEDLGI
ncbi:39S ribosomal protein L46, mitochondrial-like [Ctenocephalides felis]|uniref:39S ribosomal protein L46, mitochondrial n=1 Tax=Ctenocephalides felis TaxID=7515 RepID=UPI000E6E439E|nr:39S ribosomal protein L46, mitochondrial [Ctenocephalides felis]XP_026464008.1 39S ribosomal protein L46, mitochondrial-like [Ctenocephalides felis]